FITATTPPDISTLSLHDALPIWRIVAGALFVATQPPVPVATLRPTSAGNGRKRRARACRSVKTNLRWVTRSAARKQRRARTKHRSEEHTSELQSRRDLVCRLLLE